MMQYFYFLSLLLSLSNIIHGNDLILNKFVIVITSFNNANYYKGNLQSVFNQNYPNYRIIYIDDASTDGTANLVESFIRDHKQSHKVRLIKNPTNISQMANHYKAVFLCEDEEIIIHLDGDDCLIDGNVLNNINEVYQDKNIWITSGFAKTFPYNEVWPAICDSLKNIEVIAEETSFRQNEWIYGHIRTFRSWLFKQIKIQDLLLNSSFREMSPAPDPAFMFPMLEMAGDQHYMLVPEILYAWNMKNPVSQYALDSQKPTDLLKKIQSWQKYSPLKEKPKPKAIDSQKVNITVIIILSEINNDDNLKKYLLSVSKNIKGINNIFILYEKDKMPHKNNYNIINDNKIKSCFYKIKSNDSLHQKLLEILMTIKENYYIISTEPIMFTSIFDTDSCINQIEKSHTNLYSIDYEKKFFIENKSIFSEIPLSNTCVIQDEEFKKIGLFKNILINKEVLLRFLYKENFSSLKKFKTAWENQKLDKREALLFSNKSCLEVSE